MNVTSPHLLIHHARWQTNPRTYDVACRNGLAISSDTEPAKYNADAKKNILRFLCVVITIMFTVDSLNFGNKATENCSLMKWAYPIIHARGADKLSDHYPRAQ